MSVCRCVVLRSPGLVWRRLPLVRTLTHWERRGDSRRLLRDFAEVLPKVLPSAADGHRRGGGLRWRAGRKADQGAHLSRYVKIRVWITRSEYIMDMKHVVIYMWVYVAYVSLTCKTWPERISSTWLHKTSSLCRGSRTRRNDPGEGFRLFKTPRSYTRDQQR